MARHRTALVVAVIALVVGLGVYLLLREPSGPIVNARTASGSGLMMIVIIAIAAAARRKKRSRSHEDERHE